MIRPAPGWRPPQAVDHFVVEHPLGHGGMGWVFLARDTALDRPVALKFPLLAQPGPDARQRLLLEARAIARLSHPNVVRVFQIGEADGRPYIAYEFVPGRSLEALGAPLPWQAVLTLALGMARGLEAVHRAGLVHRDVKPSNFMLSDHGEVKLLDFGLARAFEEVAHAAPSEADASTSTSGLGGTPAYMAPELWRGERASPRADVFALGLVLRELLAGSSGRSGLPVAELQARALEDLPAVRAAALDVPESLAAVVDRCLRRVAEERFASAAELRLELEAVQQVFGASHVHPAKAGALEQEDARLVGASFARVASRMDALTERLYQHLFDEHPRLRALFPKDIHGQRAKLAHALKLAAEGLRRPESLRRALTDLGGRHAEYGVPVGDLDLLGEVLLRTLRAFDVSGWTAETEEAWQRAWAFIRETMTQGYAAVEETAATGDAALGMTPSEPGPPKTRFAESAGGQLAWQRFGNGAPLVFDPGWITHVELIWRWAGARAFLRRLGSFADVVIYDRRGMGMSDREEVAGAVEARALELLAVLDAAGVERTVLFAGADQVAVAVHLGATRPDRVRGLVLYGGAARALEAGDFPDGLSRETVGRAVTALDAQWGEPALAEWVAPSHAGDERFARWLAEATRQSVSLRNARSLVEHGSLVDVRPDAARVRAPTLVLHRAGDELVPPRLGRDLGLRIPGARYEELPGLDHLPWIGRVQPVLDEVERFVRDLDDRSGRA